MRSDFKAGKLAGRSVLVDRKRPHSEVLREFLDRKDVFCAFQRVPRFSFEFLACCPLVAVVLAPSYGGRDYMIRLSVCQYFFNKFNQNASNLYIVPCGKIALICRVFSWQD